ADRPLRRDRGHDRQHRRFGHLPFPPFRSPGTPHGDAHGAGVDRGGLLSMCGSLVLAELAVAHPHTGGLYVFIREAFGNRLGFVFGWASLSVIKPTVIAAITSVFAIYFCTAVGLPESARLPVGLAAILVLTFINWLGVKQGAGTQTLLTTAKVIGIAGLCFAAFAAGAAGHPVLLAFVLAMIPILFAYDGWTDSTYVAGEIVNPSRAMPIA